jgi:hypothetical protein
MKLGEKGRRAAIEILIHCLQEELETMGPADDAESAPRAERSPAPPNHTPPFLGRPMNAKFGGRCAVCKGAINVGAPVIYNGGSKLTAHAHCGQDDGGRRG